jgi:outer membrane protein OmpA-like peptidoglycan-associated protein
MLSAINQIFLKGTKLLAIAVFLAGASTGHAQIQTAFHSTCAENRVAATQPHRVAAESCSFTVLFPAGAAVLETETRRALDQIAPYIADHLALGGLVHVEGHADAGTPTETRTLSLHRASAVATYLEIAWGIAARRVTLHGAEPSVADGVSIPRTAQNRRVTILLHPSEMMPVSEVAAVSSSRFGSLDLDDFGGGRNPLIGPRTTIWRVPAASLD